MWQDLEPTTDIDKEKENLLLKHIMDFHIHSVDSFSDELEPDFPGTLNESDSKLDEEQANQSSRRHSEGAIIIADRASENLQLLQDEKKIVAQPPPLNRLWLQGHKLDDDNTLIHQPMRKPAGRVLNLEKSWFRSRPRVVERKSMQRLNISPVRNESNRRPISKIFLPPRMQNVRATSEKNDAGIDVTKRNRQSDYSELNEVRTLLWDRNGYRDRRSSKDASLGRSNKISNSYVPKEKSKKNEMGIVTISADAILRKVKCPPESLCEPRNIATQHLKNCLVTYIPEDGSRFVTYISDDLSQNDEQKKEMNKETISVESKLNIDSTSGEEIQPTNTKKKPNETASKENGIHLDDSNKLRPSAKVTSQKSSVNSQASRVKSLTSRAIPIDSPALKPDSTKPKLFRRKQTTRQISTCSSYAPSFPDSTIMAQIQPGGLAKGNLKFNRICTKHQKSYVTDPVADFRKEVKKMMQTRQGYLRPRLVQVPGGHAKYIAYNAPYNQSTSHGAAAISHNVEDRSRSRSIEPAQRRLIKGKNYAVVLPNVHHISAQESTPIYVISSSSTQVKSLQNEVDA